MGVMTQQVALHQDCRHRFRLARRQARGLQQIGSELPQHLVCVTRGAHASLPGTLAIHPAEGCS